MAPAKVAGRRLVRIHSPRARRYLPGARQILPTGGPAGQKLPGKYMDNRPIT
jgi:hypothetical protein